MILHRLRCRVFGGPVNTFSRYALSCAIGLTIAAAQNPPGNFVRTACIKVQPGKFAEFMQFVHGPGPKVVQAIVDSGELAASSLLRSVAPAGDEARCDFIQAD